MQISFYSFITLNMYVLVHIVGIECTRKEIYYYIIYIKEDIVERREIEGEQTRERERE